MAHAFITAGTEAEVVHAARTYGEDALQLSGNSNPDIVIYRFGLFSVDDARRVGDAAYQSSTSGRKLIVLYAARLFHEAQNALLKVIEEPPEGVTIILGVPTLGILLPTIRSRTTPLPHAAAGNTSTEPSHSVVAESFLTLGATEREKYVAKLVERTKADSENTRQAARAEAQELLSGLTQAAHAAWRAQAQPARKTELLDFLEDLAAFAPLMHERSVPLKLIFEHVLLSLPESLIRP